MGVSNEKMCKIKTYLNRNIFIIYYEIYIIFYFEIHTKKNTKTDGQMEYRTV
jgi:hypothetical protein